jgi:hypothetical protein
MTDLLTAALASLKGYRRELGCQQPCDAERALEAALAQPEVEPCNKSCAPGYCYCEPIIKPEIKGHNVKPPPEAQTEAEKIAYCAGWWAAMQRMREQAEPVAWMLPRQWQGLTEEEVFHVENNVPDSVISDRQWTVYFARALDAALRRKNT